MTQRTLMAIIIGALAIFVVAAASGISLAVAAVAAFFWLLSVLAAAAGKRAWDERRQRRAIQALMELPYRIALLNDERRREQERQMRKDK